MGELLVVDELDLVAAVGGQVRRHVLETRLRVDHDDLGGAVGEREDGTHLADGSSSEDGNLIIWVDGRVLDAII